jgi:peptide/nickel transport system ATP-binding protein
MNLLEIKQLRVTYHSANIFGKRTSIDAIRGVSLEIPEGARYGIVGESGSGKSTIAKVLIGLLKPSSGEVYFEGKRIRESGIQPKVLPTKIQVVFQDPYGSLDPGQKILEAIYEPMKVNKISNSKSEAVHTISKLFEKMGLAQEHLARYPHELSGGQRQRVCIARSVLLQPSLLILDEPTSSLDLSTQAQIAKLLRDIASEYGFTYIFISHNLELVGYMCDIICVMRYGQVVEVDARDRIFSAPKSEYTRDLIQAITPLHSPPRN